MFSAESGAHETDCTRARTELHDALTRNQLAVFAQKPRELKARWPQAIARAVCVHLDGSRIGPMTKDYRRSQRGVLYEPKLPSVHALNAATRKANV